MDDLFYPSSSWPLGDLLIVVWMNSTQVVSDKAGKCKDQDHVQELHGCQKKTPAVASPLKDLMRDQLTSRGDQFTTCLEDEAWCRLLPPPALCRPSRGLHRRRRDWVWWVPEELLLHLCKLQNYIRKVKVKVRKENYHIHYYKQINMNGGCPKSCFSTCVSCN